MFSEVLAFLDIFARVWKWFSGRKKIPVESVAARFVRLFENHGIHRNQIPRFFGHGISLEDIQSEALLVKKLDENTLNEACNLFAVRREWLDCASPKAHVVHRFYKNPNDFENFLLNLMERNPDGEFMACVIAPTESNHGEEALLIVKESVGALGPETIYRYHLCDSWAWGYWKARSYLAACVAIARRNNLYVRGIYLKTKSIEPLADGATLLGWHGEGMANIGVGRWEAEDLALQPKVFLNGIDPEQDGYGVRASLTLWLELEAQGFMRFGRDTTARALFQNELERRESRQSPVTF